MNEQKTIPAGSKLTAARVISLAGEIKDHLSGCLEFIPEYFGRPARPATVSGDVVGSEAASPPAIDSPDFSWLDSPDKPISALGDLLAAVRSELKDLKGAGIKIQRAMEEVAAQKDLLSSRRAELENRSAEEKNHLLALEEEYRRAEEKYGPELAKLENKIQDHQKYFQHLRTLSASKAKDESLPGEPLPSRMTVAQKQTDYQSSKARLDMVRAGLKRKRLAMASVNAGLKILALEIDRLSFEEKENQRQAVGLGQDWGENRRQIELGRNRLARIRDSLSGLNQARKKWEGLKNHLRSFPRVLGDLALQTEKAARFDPGESEEDLTRIDGELKDNLEAQKEVAEDIRVLGAQAIRLEQDFGVFSNKVKAFSHQLDQKTAEPSPTADGPESELKKTTRGIYTLRLERDSLLNRRDALVSRLTERREAAEDLGRQRLHLLSRQKGGIGEQLTLVRSRATQQGGLGFKARRLKEELDQIRPGVPGPAPSSPFWEDCLQKCDDFLSQIQANLQKLQTNLARAQDRLTDYSNRLKSRLDHDPLDTAATCLTGLDRLNGSADFVSRLPKQLAAYKASLIRAGLIKDLEKDCQVNQAEIERLNQEQAKMSGLLKRSRLQLDGLSQEKSRLAHDLVAARNRASGLAAHLQDEIYPLIETLGAVLYQNQVKASRLLSDNAAREEEMAALTALVAELKAGQNRAEQGQQHLGLALTALGKFNQHQKEKFLIERNLLNDRIAKVEQERRELVREYELKIEALGQQTTCLEREKLAAIQGQQQLCLAVYSLGEEQAGQVENLETEKARLKEAMDRLEDEKKTLAADHRQQVLVLEERARDLEAGRERAETVSIMIGCALTTLGEDRQRQEVEFKTERERLLSQVESLREKAEDQNNRVKQLEADHLVEVAALKKRVNALNLTSVQLDQGLKNAQENNLRLTETLAELEKEAENRNLAYQAEKIRLTKVAKAYSQRAKRLGDQLESLEAEYLDSLNLVGHQAREIKIQRELLDDMMPLLSFFMEQTQLWNQGQGFEEKPEMRLPEGSEFLVLLIHMLGHENEGLKEQVAVLTEDRIDLFRERDHLASSHQVMKNRLEEMLPVFHFLWQSWFKTTAALAESKTREVISTRELNVFRTTCHNQKSRIKFLADRLNGLENELAETRDDLVRTRNEKDRLADLEAELMGLYEKASAEAKRLAATRARMAQIIDLQDRDLLEYKKDHQRLLIDHDHLGAEKRAYVEKSEDLADEIELLNAQIFGLKGQAESAWAALSFLSVNAREKVVHLQSELSAQTETIRLLEDRLMARSAQVSQLERAQDRLALLFWIVGRYGAADQRVQEALVRLADEKNFKESLGLTGARLHHLALGAVERLKSERFRKVARQAVRRGFYSLLLAGGMVMAAPQESSKATALVPEQVNLKPMVRQLPGPNSLADNIVRGPLYSPQLDRPFDIGFLSPFERAKGIGHIRGKIIDALQDKARRLGLEESDYLNLVKKMYDQGRTVSLSELEDQHNILAVIGRLFPNIFSDFPDMITGTDTLSTLYRLAARMPEAECRVWDRLYLDFTHLEKDRNKCLGMVITNACWRLAGTGREQVPEFAGKLKPIPALEKLDVAGFSKVIIPYFRANIKAVIAKPAFSYAHKAEEVDAYAKRLAEDMYVAANTFGVPLTLMVSIAHQETYFANLMGDNSLSASPFQIYRPTKPLITKIMAQKGFQTPEAPERLEEHLTLATYMAAFYMSNLIELRSNTWNKQKPPLCDLDRVALAYNGNDIYPGEVYKKKVRLMNYLEKVRKLAANRKSPLS